MERSPDTRDVSRLQLGLGDSLLEVESEEEVGQRCCGHVEAGLEDIEDDQSCHDSIIHTRVVRNIHVLEVILGVQSLTERPQDHVGHGWGGCQGGQQGRLVRRTGVDVGEDVDCSQPGLGEPVAVEDEPGHVEDVVRYTRPAIASFSISSLPEKKSSMNLASSTTRLLKSKNDENSTYYQYLLYDIH